MITDTLRPPPPFDPSATAYKDWLHLNVFDPASGAIAIFNASLHGAPREPAARAIGTALVHLPGEGWIGNVEVLDLAEAHVGTNSIALARVALATDPAGYVLASARLADDGLEAGVTARAVAHPVDVAHPLPFGPGWISWYVVPRLSVTGGIVANGRRIDLADAAAYHDHNWGRWHWGADVGWSWGTCTGEGVALVVSRATDRAHDTTSGASLIADVAGERRIFPGGSLTIEGEGVLAGPPRRLPGALAALHQDRRAPRLPARLLVRADDGVDAVEIEFTPRAAAQLIAGDPARPGYGFLHEMPGEFIAGGRLSGRPWTARGLGIFEHVD